MTTRDNHFDQNGESEKEESPPVEIAHAEDITLRQETIGAVGAVNAVGAMGSGISGSRAYTGGATLFGLTAPFGQGKDSDGQLAESAELALVEEPRLATDTATGIRIDAAFGVLELSGEVPTEADKKIAEEAVSHLAGVSAVENKLHVK